MDAGKGYNISMNQDKRHKISTREVRFALDEITDIRKKLSEAMEYLLSRKNLDDIPVSEIAKMAGVSRRTFYRHFCDKYELVNWYYNASKALFVKFIVITVYQFVLITEMAVKGPS